MRIAAAADLHVRQDHAQLVRDLFTDIRGEADVLVLAGDLTDHGRPAEVEALIHGLRDIEIPVVAVLGNHDHEAGWTPDMHRMLESAGIHLLEREKVVIDGVGFAGAKGFAGGFGDRIVRGFGEDALKAFVSESVVESEGLRRALLELRDVQHRVAVTHYAPIVETVQGEPREIHPFLGTSRLEEAIDDARAAVSFHGHAHRGTLQGKTRRGVPVWNVSLPVLRAAGLTRPFHVVEL